MNTDLLNELKFTYFTNRLGKVIHAMIEKRKGREDRVYMNYRGSKKRRTPGGTNYRSQGWKGKYLTFEQFNKMKLTPVQL